MDKIIREFSEVPKLYNSTRVDLRTNNIGHKVIFDPEAFNNVNTLERNKQIIFSYEWRIEF
jgi:hypothetical protein